MRLGSANASLNATGCIILPAALFVGLMIATAGMAIYPGVTAIANPLICAGEVVYESRNYSYRPGQRGVERFIYCQTGEGKGGQEDIIWKAMGVSFLLYSAIAFLLLRFIVAPLLRHRVRDTLEAARSRFRPAHAASSGEASPVDLQDIIGRVTEVIERDDAHVVVRNTSIDASAGDDVAGRLARLKQLRDQGLITAADYEAKKAEILSGL